MAEHDYSAFQPEPSQDMFARLSDLARRKHHYEELIGNLEDQLAAAQEEHRAISEREIPELMQSMGLSEFTTTQGFKIRLKEEVRANWPKDARREKAVSWLDENGLGDVVKHTLTIQFNKDEAEWVAKFKRDLAQRKRPLRVEENAVVHHQTLLKLLRDELSEGHAVPLELFGSSEEKPAFVQKVAKIG